MSRLCRTHHSPKILLPQPFLNLFKGVLGVIILPKGDIRRIKTIMLQEIKQLILQNLKVKVAVHPAINLGGKTSSLSSHAPPNHDRSTFELNCSLYLPIIKPLSWLFPHPFAPI